MATTNDIPVETQRAIIENEIDAWKNTRYQHEVRLRVSRRVGDTPEMEADIIKILARCEKALDALAAELEGLAA